MNILFILLIVFGLASLLQLFFYLFYFIRVGISTQIKQEITSFPPVSVVICARNESENLKKNLPLLLLQDYPEYEIVIVNDCSVDETIDILPQLKLQYPHLRYTNIEQDKKFRHGKKLALTVGIKSAKYDHVLLTDADCVPVSRNWIKDMMQNFSDKKEIVIGYCGLEKQKGLLNNFIRFDNFFEALQYLGAAKAGIPYGGKGRNLAYIKDLFFRNKGFASHAHINAGDDDLFINHCATSQNTAVQISRDSKILTTPKTTFNEWFKQRSKHLMTFNYYRFGAKLYLGAEAFSKIIFYSLLIYFVAIQSEYLNYIYYIAGCKILVQLIVFKITMNKLQEKGFWFISIFYDIILPFIYLILFLYNHIVFKKRR